MKRRFPILLKVILLGTIVSVLTAGTAITVSSFNQKKRSEKTLVENIDNTLDEAAYVYMGDTSPDAVDCIGELQTVKDYVERTFNGLSPQDKTTLEDYDSFKDYATHYQDLYPWIYVKGMGFGLSEEMSRFRYAYASVLNLLANFQMSSGSKSVFLAINSELDDKTMIFLTDSRIFNYDNQFLTYYHVPGSFYNIKDSDYVVNDEDERHEGFILDGYYTRFIQIRDANTQDSPVIATLYIEYDLDAIEKQSLEIFKTELLILGLSSLALVAIYTIFSYLFFVRNINKLSKVSSEIKERLVNKNMNEIVDIPVKSNDEIEILADSLTEMEKAIINYVDIINQETIEKERTNAELTVASNIQLGSLPANKFEDQNVSVRAYIKPAKEVGGDFYDYFYLDDHRLVVLISDVSGKGIPASLFMMKGKELIKSALMSYSSLKDAITSVNKMLCKNNKELLFITSFIGVIDFNKKEIRYINAGQEKPYIISKQKVIKLDGESNVVLGVEDYQFIEDVHPFNEGDYLFMFTDGLNESINSKGEEFSYERIEKCLSDNNSASLEEILNDMNFRFVEFLGSEEQFDDTTILLAKFKSNELNLHYEKKDYEIINEIVDTFNDYYPYLSEKIRSSVGIIIDELINNYISYEKREDLVIDIHFKSGKKGLSLQIVTNGADYNPFDNRKEKYLEDYHSEIEEGGFGLSIVKDLAESYSYQYKNQQTIIELQLSD